MHHLIIAKRLWKYVDGTATEDASAEARVKYTSESQKAISTIVMAIPTRQLYLVTTCKKKHFQHDTLADKLYLKEQYFQKEMKEGTPVITHLNEITEKLASIGAPIMEENQVVTPLGSLPLTYTTIFIAFEARMDDISLDFVQQSLIHEEQKQKSKDQSSDHQQALALMGGNKCKPPVCWIVR